MSFLDNLENSLKNLESREERDPNEGRRRADERARVLAAAPWAEELKNSAYTKDLFNKAAIAGHKIRAKVYMAWFETVLRLEAKGRILELRPTADGVVAHYDEIEEPIDLSSDPDVLLGRWLGI